MTTSITNISSPVAGLTLGALVEQAKSSTSIPAPVSVEPVPPTPNTASTKSAKKATRAESAYQPSKRHLDAMATVVADVTRTLQGDGNLWNVLAKFGEAAGLAGNPDRVKLALAALQTKPDAYFPAGAPVETRAAILKRCDKGRDEAEYSRTVGAITAGSALTEMLSQAYQVMSTKEGGMSAMTRVAKSLISDCRKARVEMGTAVPEGWNGGGIDLQSIIDKATGTESKARAATSAGRTVAKATSAAPTATPTPAAAPAAGTAANVAASVTAAAGEPAQPDWQKSLSSIEGILAGLPTRSPDAARKQVNEQITMIRVALGNIKAACAAHTGKPTAESPAGVLVKAGGVLEAFGDK